MSRENRKASFDFALRDSGERLNTYKGVSHYGIALEVLQEFRPEATACEIASLSRVGALRIYAQVYWKYPRCDALNSGLDYFVFDTGLVCGPARSAAWVEQLAGPAAHGFEEAIEYANSLELETAISGIEFFRRRRFKTDPLWPVLGAEWTNRCNRAKTRALRLGAGELAKERDTLSLATA